MGYSSHQLWSQRGLFWLHLMSAACCVTLRTPLASFADSPGLCGGLTVTQATHWLSERAVEHALHPALHAMLFLQLPGRARLRPCPGVMGREALGGRRPGQRQQKVRPTAAARAPGTSLPACLAARLPTAHLGRVGEQATPLWRLRHLRCCCCWSV